MSHGSSGPGFFVSGGIRGTSTARCWQNSGGSGVGDTGGCRIVGYGSAGRLFRSGNPVALGGSAAALARCGVRASHCPIVANRAIVDRAGGRSLEYPAGLAFADSVSAVFRSASGRGRTAVSATPHKRLLWLPAAIVAAVVFRFRSAGVRIDSNSSSGFWLRCSFYARYKRSLGLVTK